MKQTSGLLVGVNVALWAGWCCAQMPFPGAQPGASVASGSSAVMPASATGSSFIDLPAPQAKPPNASALGAQMVATVPTETLHDADLICVVGSEHILAGDLRALIEPIIEENRKRISASQEPEVRQQLTRQALKQYVEIKALYQEFFRDMAGTGGPDELKETRQKVLSRANKVFYEQQVPTLLKNYKVNDLAALEQELRKKSMSVALMRQQFIERVLASQAEHKAIPEEVVIGREELLANYQANETKWHKAGRARWRQLTARFDRFSTKSETRAAIESMGNEIFLGGKPFEAVAKEKSQGYSAANGGSFDWTTQGSLKSSELNKAIFTIPLGRLSQVIEDDVGYHIIEVLEREEPRTVPFEEAQAEIRDELVAQKRSELREQYHAKVMARTIIWTRWPQDIPGSRSLVEVIEASP